MSIVQIVVVGEAWGAEEERTQNPFVGAAGYELTRLLNDAGIRRTECYLTNVFNLRPKNNDLSTLCVGAKDPNAFREMPALHHGKFLHRQFAPELTRLYGELSRLRPNITIAFGATAAWALLLSNGIGKVRGTVTEATASAVAGLKVLPTYHPAAVLRQWDLRPIVVMDLIKAATESLFPEVRRPERTIYIEPSLSDLEWYYEGYLARATRLSFDIETFGVQITCIGFAPDRGSALVLPFVDQRRDGGSYWPTLADEIKAWQFVRRVLALPIPKVAQNGTFDIRFLWQNYGIPVVNFEDDTMLLHHALQPESEKGLGFLASIYCNDGAWKLMRPRGKGTIKRDQ